MAFLETAVTKRSDKYAFGECNSYEYCGIYLTSWDSISDGDFLFYENPKTEKGFNIAKKSSAWHLEHNCIKGAFNGDTVFLSGHEGKDADVEYVEGTTTQFRVTVKDKCFSIICWPGEAIYEILFYDKKIEVKRLGSSSSENYSKVIVNDAPFGFNFRIALMDLPGLDVNQDVYTDEDSDWMVCRQSLSYDNFTGYGFSRWEDGDLYMGEYTYDQGRTGLGCYRWPNNDSFMGRFFKNKVDGFGVYLRNKVCEIGCFDEKKKKGTFVEYDKSRPNIVVVKKYDSYEEQYGDYIELDIRTMKLTYFSEYEGRKSFQL